MGERKTDEDRRGMLIGGLVTLGVGTIFLLSNLDIIPDIREMWPLIPITVGIALIIGAFVRGSKSEKPDQSPQ